MSWSDNVVANREPQTSFEQVSEMNTAFGNPAGDPNAVDWIKFENQIKNILDEYNELLGAIALKDVKEARDALCDIDVFSFGAHHFLGHNADHDLNLVYESNMSKFCVDQQMADDSILKYQNLGVETYLEGEFPRMAIKSSKEQTDINGEVYRKGKFLKSTGYFKPKF